MRSEVSRDVYASAFDHSLDAVFLAHPDGTTFAANKAGCALLGRSEEEICRLGRAGLVDPESPGQAELLAERQRTGSSRGVVWLIHADGSRIPVELTASGFSDDEGRRWNVVTAHDLRQIHKVQDELRSTQLLLTTIVDTTRDFIWSVNPDDFGILWFNRALKEYFSVGRGIELATGMRPDDLFDDAAYIDYWKSLYRKALADGSSTAEYAVAAGTHMLQLTLTTMRRDGEVVGISVFGRDITPEWHSRDALEKSEARYRTIFDTVTEGIVFQAADGTIFSVNRAAERIGGRRQADMLGKTSEDPQWGSVRADGSPFPGDEHPAMVTLRTGEPQTGIVMGILTPNGERRWISINSTPVFDDVSATPTAVVSMFHDITRQKHAEDDLRVAAIAFEESQEAMLIADADTTILRVNRAFVGMTGYSAAEAVGQTTRLLSSGRQGREFYARLWDDLRVNRRWQGEIWNRRRNGEIYPEWLSITAVTDEHDQVVNYVATFIDLSGAKKAEQDIHQLSFYDSLTGLPNRALLADRLRQSILASGRETNHGCLFVLDLDDFTVLNDVRGHDAGDLLLREVGRLLTATVHVDDTVARLGSDEFAIVINALHADADMAARQAEQLAQRLREALAAPLVIDGEPYQCRVSIGIAMFALGEPEPAELLKRADAAVMQAKRAGRNTAHFFNPELQADLEDRVRLETALHMAIPDGLRLAYQPQVSDHADVIGAEALIRWQDPEFGAVPPATFIPLAEGNGLIRPIGQWVLETACAQIKRWEADASTRHLVLAVNVSARQFHQDDFVETVLGALSRTGADASRLELELTESLLVEDIGAVAAKMHELRRRGVRFSLDDFGTGFSSLRSLKDLPLHQLKIDQSFVHDLSTNPNSAAIVRATIALGQSLGLSVIAEGVETPEQFAMLKTLGCTVFQGYLFGRPGPVDDLTDLINAALKSD